MAILGTLTLDVLVFLLICITLLLAGFFIGWFFKRNSSSNREFPENIRRPKIPLERIVAEADNDKREEPYSNYCPKCGKQMDEREQFCTKCGVDLIVRDHYPHNLF
ncbi:MAG: zinc-ribbon domain-containing protein [Asgard group archaeon]|nr:zinc-ribbon domain-containing protein [Asgard group archaeon]